MRIIEVSPDRWLVEVGAGLVLEVQLVGGVAWGWWRWRGELVSEVAVGEG